MSGVPEGLAVAIPRCYQPPGFGRVVRSEIHVFCDASAQAIGLVIYLKRWNESNQTAVSFVLGSSKVGPRAATSIPRLELCAAVEATRITGKIIKELDIRVDQTVYYSDNMIVLGYLTNTSKSFQRYVTSRVSVILKRSDPNQWRYIPTKENPADIATRPHTPSALKDTIWLDGPDFLSSPDYLLSDPGPSKAPTEYQGKLPVEIEVVKTLKTLTNAPDILKICGERYEY